MNTSKKYFFLSLILILISCYFNTLNPLLDFHFKSIILLILICSIVNTIIILLAIHFNDKSIKSLHSHSGWVRGASRILPFIIMIVIALHILAALYTFGIFN
ncbi:hypothetical protein [Staphylococcus massiliensis]|uniref:Cytochrome oxidase subunit II transmembrane region profile domain-containing protein n=1 Tax=Staphylococcus massiliensis S46 TaxID=1229783 RepID=K9ASJ7_9STAP|nr:hypothetical protein [Staphylococcus massiliensis]EKU50294.1 hypothetical protein C273_01590 [Staphylococcus massiliensis S46]MCG3399680.1 hypothetical protein [Staphylococcus massiliensis]MCG3400785.1 hypothetical protein [Staphylococcus massiliensis]MCG3412051.1 hypothetical protein [Staphylococcus massiliensis]PNZ99043.1 hypothetical protein CD133_07095 [Staphylococcus massiliensis CCUG 55927]